MSLETSTKGGDKMVSDYSLFEEKIKEKFYSKERFAEKLGMSRTSLYSKLTGRTQFKHTEITKAMKLLRLSESQISRYFFTIKV